MVDFRNGASRTDDLTMMMKRLAAVEQKVGALSATMDARFDAVDEAFADQRKFIEFTFETLAAKVDAGFAPIDGRFAQIDGRLAQVDRRLAQIDGRFGRLERKLDAFVDTQSTANALVERRLNALERRRRPGPAR